MARITNPNDSERVAGILRMVADAISGTSNIQVEEKSKDLPGAKGSLLVEILIGIGISAAWDAIKYVVRRAGQIAWGEDDVIEVDGEPRRLKDLSDDEDSDGST